MQDDINRSEKRRQASIHAFVTDLAGQFQVKCVLRDISKNGCRIVSSRAVELPDVVQVVPEGFKAPLRGMIMWKRSNLAGVCFEHGCNADQRAVIAHCNAAVRSQHDGEDYAPVQAKASLSYAELLKSYRPAAE